MPSIRLPVLGPTLLLLAAACGDPSAAAPPAQQPAEFHVSADGGVAKTGNLGEQTPAAGAHGAAEAAAALPTGGAPIPGGSKARVVETIDGGGYTYVQIEAGGKRDWYAVTQCDLKAGEDVLVPNAPLPQYGFKSPSLNRTFEVIYFAQGFARANAPALDSEAAKAQVRAAHGGAPAPSTAVELTGIARADGGMTVAEIWADSTAGKDVVLRAKVVKYNAGILGKNWLHVRDGSGSDGSNDLTVTTADTAKVGDTVLVRGKVSKDLDIGAGYFFARILQDAKVTVEK